VSKLPKWDHPSDGQWDEFYGHIGLYAFRMNILKEFVALGPSRLETAEKLELLRAENRIKISSCPSLSHHILTRLLA
jgi:3-deoxy-manno-octulosonate cytidylyltransferase (CMP-KDO synthetase)